MSDSVDSFTTLINHSVDSFATLTNRNPLLIFSEASTTSTLIYSLGVTEALYVVTNAARGRHVSVRRRGAVVANIRRPTSLLGLGRKPPTVHFAHWTGEAMEVQSWTLDTRKGKAMLLEGELYTWVERRTSSGTAAYLASNSGQRFMWPSMLIFPSW